MIPSKGNYLKKSGNPESSANLHLSTGHPDDPLWPRIEPRLQGATEMDVLASFVQPSGLDLIQSALFLALKTGARVQHSCWRLLIYYRPRSPPPPASLDGTRKRGTCCRQF